MLPHIFPISSLMAGTALLLLGTGLTATLIVLRGTSEGFSDQFLGLIGSGYFVGFLIGAWVVPRLIRRIGHIRAFNFFAASIAALVLLHSILVNPWVWLVLRLLTGIMLVGFYTVIESWLNSRSVPERRGQVFAVYMAVNMGAMALAQQLLHAGDPQSFVLFSLAAVLVCLSVLPLASTRQPQPEIHTLPRLSLREVWQAAPTAVMGTIVSGLIIATFWSIAPLYASRLGLDASGVAMLMTSAIAGGALLQVPLGRLSDRGDRRRVLALAGSGAALAAVAMAFIPPGDIWLFVAAFLFGGMAFALYPIAVAHLIDRLSNEHILSGNSAMLLLHGVGAIFGPVLAGVLMGLFGPAAVPLMLAAMLGPFTLFVLWRVRRARDEVVEEAAHFQPMLRTAGTAMEIAAAVEEHYIETAQEEAETEARLAEEEAGEDGAGPAKTATPAEGDDTTEGSEGTEATENTAVTATEKAPDTPGTPATPDENPAGSDPDVEPPNPSGSGPRRQ